MNERTKKHINERGMKEESPLYIKSGSTAVYITGNNKFVLTEAYNST